MKTSSLTDCFPNLEKKLVDEIEVHSIVKNFAAREYIVKQGQLIRFLPVVLDGNVKVFHDEADAPFLLYYISSGETCIYSFAHTFNNEPAEFSAMAELDSKLLLLPLIKVNLWLQLYPSFSSLVINNYQKHYKDLLNTTRQVICHNLEERLIDYLHTKVQIEQSDLLSISHQEIAHDLGTSREVVSRLMKKLGLNQKVKQVGRKIKVL